MAEIFISYSRKDKEFVQKLGDAFTNAKRDAWLDSKDIPLTSEWQQEIFSNIESADNFLFIISPESVASANCRKEIDRAVANNKRMLPILYRAVADDAVPETLAKFQRIDFDHDNQFDEKFAALLKALDTDVNWVQTHTRLLTRAKEWEREGNDRSFFLRGKDLTEAEQWVAKGVEREPKPTTLQSQYILASRQAATKTQRIIIGAVAIAFLIAVGLAIYAFRQKNVAQFETKEAQTQRGKADANAITAQKNADEATQQRNTAVANAIEAKRQEGIAKEETAKAILQAKITNARRLATESIYRFGYTADDLAVSGALALESLEAYPTTEGMKALYQVLRLIPAAPQIIPDAHKGSVGALAFSHDGRWMASGGANYGQVILWDVSNNMKRRALEGQLPYYSPDGAMAFSRNGQWLAAGCARGGGDSALCIWDTATEKSLGNPIHHAHVVRSVAFSPNGQYLATSTHGEGAGRGARLFRTSSSPWEPVEPFSSGEGPYVSVLFGEDGALAVADKSGIWVTQPTSSPTGDAMRFTDSGPCYALGLSIATSAVKALCQKGIATATPKDQKYEFEGVQIRFSDIHSVEGLRMSASPDGEFVVVGDIVYSIRDSSPSLVLAPLGRSLGAVAYHPDGKVVAGGLEDGSIALWPTTLGNASIRVPSPGSAVTAVSIGPDERLLATVSQDGTLRLYDISEAAHIRLGPQQKVGSDVKAVSFSPDGRFLVLTSENRVRLLHPDTLKPIADLGVSGQIVSAFARDNRILLLLDSIGVHRFATTTLREIPPVMSGKFKDFSLSPDGKQIATWSQFNVGGQHHYIEARRVWNLTTGTEVAWDEKGREPSDGPASGPPKGGSQQLVQESARWPSSQQSSSKSPDGVLSFDLNEHSSTFVLEEAGTKRPVARFEHNGRLTGATFSPRGRWLVSASKEGSVLLWPLQVNDLAAQACKLLPRNLTPDEWKDFQMDGPYRKVCPNLP